MQTNAGDYGLHREGTPRQCARLAKRMKSMSYAACAAQAPLRTVACAAQGPHCGGDIKIAAHQPCAPSVLRRGPGFPRGRVADSSSYERTKIKRSCAATFAEFARVQEDKNFQEREPPKKLNYVLSLWGGVWVISIFTSRIEGS